MYLRGVSGLAVLPLPLTVPKAALHTDFVPLAEVFFTDFRGLVPDHYIVPFGLGDLFPTLFIGESFIGGQGKPAPTAAPFKIVDLRIIPQLPYQHDLVQCPAHNFLKTKSTKF